MSTKDTVGKTILVAGVLCVVCSVIVSSAAVFLKPIQTKNQLLDKKKNILTAAGMYEPGDDIEQKFSTFKSGVVDFASGELLSPETAPEGVDLLEGFDQKKAAKDPKLSIAIDPSVDYGGIKRRSKYGQVYFVMEGDSVSKIILPVHGKGLWSTMYGFIALNSDTKTVEGITFYEHGETPGLGGEIENPSWQESWKGKLAFDEQGQPAIEVLKGKVDSTTSNAQYKIDGLSGATITSRGVSGTMKYWLSENAYGPFLQKFRDGSVF